LSLDHFSGPLGKPAGKFLGKGITAMGANINIIVIRIKLFLSKMLTKITVNLIRDCKTRTQFICIKRFSTINAGYISFIIFFYV
jgi:hypothetical protein